MSDDKTIWEKMKGDMTPVPRSLLATVVETLVAQIKKGFDKHATTLESLERRASRHATHLAALEDRLKILEHK